MNSNYAIEISPKFTKSLKKLHPEIQKKVKKIFKQLHKNPYNLQLRTHKLKGKLKNHFALSVKYNLRIVFKFIDKNTILLISIGTHSKVY